MSSTPSNWNSYKLKFTGNQLVTARCALHTWMPYCGKWPMKYWNVGCSQATYSFAPPLSNLSNQKMDSMRFASWTAGHRYHTSGQLYTSYEVRLPPLGGEPCVERPRLPCVFFSPQTPGYSSSLPEPKHKCYFIRWHSLWREGCIVSFRQPPVGLVIFRGGRYYMLPYRYDNECFEL